MRLASNLVVLSCSGFLGCSTTNTATPDGPIAPGPDAAPVLSNKELALAALQGVYVTKDPTAVDTYFDPAFIRHDPSATADGTAAFKAQIAGSLPNVQWKSFTALQQDDFVIVHDEYDNFPTAGVKTIAFDMFRFANAKIAEHWTCQETDPGVYASGHTMVDGSPAIDPTGNTAASEALVVAPTTGFVPVVIIGGDFSKLAQYLTPDFEQHNPLIADGIQGVGAAFMMPPLNTIKVVEIPESTSEANFGFTRSKGTLTWDEKKPNSPNNPTVYCDLFRVAGGKIVEHWDVIQLDPNSTDIAHVNTNGAGHTLWD